MNVSRELLLRLMLPLALGLLGLGLYAWLVPLETHAVATQLLGFPDSDAAAHLLRPRVLGALCFLPAIAGFVYALSGALSRYLARQFMGIFLLCLVALFTVWLLVDLENNLGDIRSGKHVFETLCLFYATRLPAVLLLLLPYTLLLSLLYCLGKLSKSREILAMIQTGRSLPRVTFPLIAAGILCTALCAGLNYHWAPVAESAGAEILQKAKGSFVVRASNVLYRNAAANRLWMVGTFPPDYEKGAPLLDVEVTTTTANGKLDHRIAATRAIWSGKDGSWTFENPVVTSFSPGMAPEYSKQEDSIVKRGWTETPWQLIKPGLSAPYLGMPDLNGWLNANKGNETTMKPAAYLTQWHYRLAQPFVCLVTVLLAAPLGIHFSRRGSTGGVAMAVVLSGGLMFLSTVSLSLGESGYISPALSAWLPNIVFALLGLYLFHRRIAGRPIYQSLLRMFPGAD